MQSEKNQNPWNRNSMRRSSQSNFIFKKIFDQKLSQWNLIGKFSVKGFLDFPPGLGSTTKLQCTTCTTRALKPWVNSEHNIHCTFYLRNGCIWRERINTRENEIKPKRIIIGRNGMLDLSGWSGLPELLRSWRRLIPTPWPRYVHWSIFLEPNQPNPIKSPTQHMPVKRLLDPNLPNPP